MYLTAGDNTEILLRTIDDLEQLVGEGAISDGAAFEVIAKIALHHPEHPQKEAEKAAKRAERNAEVEAKNSQAPIEI
jgi:hypothetical protein